MFGAWFSTTMMLRTRSSIGANLRFDVNVHVDGARVSHRVALVDRQVLHEKQLFSDRGLEEAQIDGGARAELGEIEFLQAIVEATQAGQLGVDGEASVLVDPAIVFVETESGRLERAGGEITANVFVRDDVQLGVGFEGRSGLRRRRGF